MRHNALHPQPFCTLQAFEIDFVREDAAAPARHRVGPARPRTASRGPLGGEAPKIPVVLRCPMVEDEVYPDHSDRPHPQRRRRARSQQVRDVLGARAPFQVSLVAHTLPATAWRGVKSPPLKKVHFYS